MKITDYRIYELQLPLIKPFKTALREVSVLTTNILELHTDTGEIGYGEASPTAVITGDGKGSILEGIENYIFPAVKDMDIEELDTIMKKIDNSMVRNSSPKAAVDMAVYDLFGKHFKIPLYKYFGGAKSEFESDITVSINSPEEMALDAVNYVQQGYKILKIKLGKDSLVDIDRIKSIVKAVGNDIKIRIDANQGWNAKEAVKTIRRIEDIGFNLDLVEQPVPHDDLEGLKFVTEHVETPIMADEALFSPKDAMNILSTRAADILNIKLMKAGGLHNAQKICAMAEACGVQCMIGSMMESRVGITAAAHFAGAKNNITRADLDASTLLAVNPVDGGAITLGNKIILTDGFGLGINRINY